MTAKTTNHCLDEVQISQFLESEVDLDREQQMMSHVATCEQCQKALERIAGNDQVWSEIKDHLVEQRERFEDEATHDDWNGARRQPDLLKVKQMLGPTDNPEMIGRLGQYEVCGIIGRGSAGIVVKALDTRLNRYVAIKMLAPVYSTNGSSRRRFEREGRAIASVKDPNVVPIHTVGEYQGTPYIVMQYVPDGSLQQRIDRDGPLTTRDVTCLGMQVANGLAAAHRRGIVHRDVKPANVLLESGVESALVTDFGLARVVDEATMTRSGAISGTPQFMSPEQARGESVDPRSDLFSLGSVMYAACTGHSPFRAESVFGVIKRVCESEPRAIREFNPEIEPWLAALIEKLHAKDPEDRFESAEQVAQLLAQELAHLENPTLVDVPKRDWWKRLKPKLARSKKQANAKSPARVRIMWGTIAAAIVVVAGFGAWQQWGSPNLGELLGVVGDESGKGNGTYASVTSSMPESWSELSPQAILDLVREENQQLEHFDNTIEKEIRVKAGGKLYLRTNLGTVDVKRHDQPVVKLIMVHTVGAKDEATADKLFAATKIRYETSGEAEADWNVSPGSDAVIVADFPVGKLTDEEIEQADDLEELKEQLLIRKNSHFRNARFELQVPMQFNLDIETMAGPISTEDVDGSASLQSYAGNISMGDVAGDANLTSMAGNIEVGRVEGTLTALTQGGLIAAEQLNGEATLESAAGGVEIGLAKQPVQVRSATGRVRVWMAEQTVDAKIDAGNIEVNFVGQPNGSSKLVTDAGSIEVGYVDGLSLQIVADAELGKIKSPFAEKASQTLNYSLNEGKSTVEATTTIGSIVFRKVDREGLEKNYKEEREQKQASRAFQRAYDTHLAGHIEAAVALHQRAAEYPAYRGIATYNLGCAYALLGKKDEALQALQNAFEFGYRDVEQWRKDADLDSLRDESKFKEIMKQLKGNADEKEQNNSSCNDAVCEQRV